jgi:hypothetical protein
MLAAPGSVLATMARTLASPRRRRPSWTLSNLTAAERVHFVSAVSQPRCLETHGRFQTVEATGAISFLETSSLSRSAGVLRLRVLRGRSLSSVATSRSRGALWAFRSVPLGKYWRSRPLVFSFEPRCQGEAGSQSSIRAGIPHRPRPTLVLVLFEPATGCKVLALTRDLPKMSENWRIPLCLQGTGRFTASNCTRSIRVG